MRQDTNTTTTTSTHASPDAAHSGSVGRHPRSTSPTSESATATRVADRTWVVVGAVVVTMAIVAGVWIALASSPESTGSDGARLAEAANQVRRAEVDTIAGNAVDISTVAERANQRRRIEAGVPLDAPVPNGHAIAAEKGNALQRADARPTHGGADLAKATNAVRRADASASTATSTTMHNGAALAEAANRLRQHDTPRMTGDAVAAEKANRLRQAG